jgi:preprotein translocase subunit SecY
MKREHDVLDYRIQKPRKSARDLLALTLLIALALVFVFLVWFAYMVVNLLFQPPQP